MPESDKIIPDLQSALVCEDVRQEVNGMQSIIGVLSAVPSPQLPVRLLKLCIWTRWCGGVGSFLQQARILSPDEEEKIGEAQVHFQLREMEAQATNVHFFSGATFREYGRHVVEIYLDGDLRLRFLLPVIQIRKQP